MSTANHRLKSTYQNEERRDVTFTFNGQTLSGFEGEPIAAALMAHGIKSIRVDDATGEPRGIYCGIGHCYECRAEVNGTSGVRTCLTPLCEGIVVNSTSSWGRGFNDEEG